MGFIQVLILLVAVFLAANLALTVSWPCVRLAPKGLDLLLCTNKKAKPHRSPFLNLEAFCSRDVLQILGDKDLTV
jgi:hypothetical protein